MLFSSPVPIRATVNGIACIGDSQTEGTSVAAANRWAKVLEVSTGQHTRNWGVSSAKAGWFLDRDAGETPAPTNVPVSTWTRAGARIYLVMFGLNDVSAGYYPALTAGQRLDMFEANTSALVDAVRGAGGIPVLMTNAKYPSEYTNYVQRNADTTTYDQIKRDLVAADPSVYLVDLWQRFSDEIDASNVDWFVSAADLHWNIEGHSIAANEIETYLSAQGLI